MCFVLKQQILFFDTKKQKHLILIEDLPTDNPHLFFQAFGQHSLTFAQRL